MNHEKIALCIELLEFIKNYPHYKAIEHIKKAFTKTNGEDFSVCVATLDEMGLILLERKNFSATGHWVVSLKNKAISISKNELQLLFYPMASNESDMIFEYISKISGVFDETTKDIHFQYTSRETWNELMEIFKSYDIVNNTERDSFGINTAYWFTPEGRKIKMFYGTFTKFLESQRAQNVKSVNYDNRIDKSIKIEGDGNQVQSLDKASHNPLTQKISKSTAAHNPKRSWLEIIYWIFGIIVSATIIYAFLNSIS